MSGKKTPRIERLAVLAALVCLGAGLPAGAQDAYPRGDRVAEGDWPLWRHDLSNSGACKLSVSARPRAWTFQPPRHPWGYQPGMTVWSPVAIGTADGKPVVVAGSHDRNVYVLDAATGAKRWRFTTGAGVYATPLIWHDKEKGWIFVASSDRLVYGLDASSGARRWSHAVADYQPTTGGARLSAPAVGLAGGRPVLFVGHWVWDKSLTHSTQQGGMTAIDIETGKRLWQKPFLDNRVSAPVFGRMGGRGLVYVASEDGNLRALDAETGSQIWYHRETEPIMGAPLLHRSPGGGRVVIGSHFGKLRSLDALTGKEIWTHKTGNWITGSAALVSTGDRELVMFGSYDQKFYALDRQSGQPVWSQVVAGPIFSSPAVIDRESDPAIVFSAWDHNLYGVSGKKGTVLWSVFTGQPLWDGLVMGDSNWASPAVARIGERWMIYHGSYDGTLYAIPSSQAALAGGSHPWSTWRFWLTMFVVLAATAGLALYLTRRGRSQREDR